MSIWHFTIVKVFLSSFLKTNTMEQLSEIKWGSIISGQGESTLSFL